VVVTVSEHDVGSNPAEEISANVGRIVSLVCQDVQQIGIGGVAAEHLIQVEHGQSGYRHEPQSALGAIKASHQQNITTSNLGELEVDRVDTHVSSQKQGECFVTHGGTPVGG
jgi:hypothetical protein